MLVNNKKKILIVSNMYPSAAYPHYGVFVQHTAEILLSEGNTVDVVSMAKQDSISKKVFSYVRFYISVIAKGLLGHYDVIYAHYASHTALPLLILEKLKKTRIVINVHGNDVVPECEKDAMYLPLVQKLLNCAEAVICPSDYFKEIVNREFGIQKKKILVYPSGGVDTELFRKIPREQAAQRLDLCEKNAYIGYVSRIEEKKGWDLFLLAAAKLREDHPEFRYIVVGDGDQATQFQELVASLNLSDVIIKFNLLPQSEISHIFNLLDVFVFPTYRASESLGLVGLEAMACEAVCVLPDRYGPASYGRDEENAYIFKAGNADSLYEAIKRALHGTNEEIRSNARKTALRYNHEHTDSILLDFFSDL